MRPVLSRSHCAAALSFALGAASPHTLSSSRSPNSLRPPPPPPPPPPPLHLPLPVLGAAVDIKWEGTWWEAELRQKDSAAPLLPWYVGTKTWEAEKASLESFKWDVAAGEVRHGQVWDPQAGEAGEWALRMTAPAAFKVAPAPVAPAPGAPASKHGGKTSGKRAHEEGGDDNGENAAPAGVATGKAAKAARKTTTSPAAAALTPSGVSPGAAAAAHGLA